MATPERVVITAAGVVTPIGQDLEAFWSSLVTGASGISQIERVPVADLRVQRGGEIKKLGRIKDWRGVPDCRATRLLIAAADDLCAQAGFRPLPLDPARVGVVVGTALGGVEEGEKALAGDRDRRRLSQALYDGPGWALARWLGARGPVITVSTACASGRHRDGGRGRSAARGRGGRGGGGRLRRALPLRAARLRRPALADARRGPAVRPAPQRPAPGRGGRARPAACASATRGARGSARSSATAAPATASTSRRPSPKAAASSGPSGPRSPTRGCRPRDVDFVSAHGTATPLNDRIETAVLKRALGRRAHEMPVNSIKGSLGHTMGAAAALEAFMCLLSAQRGLIPPTLHLEEPDPECDLDYVPGRARPGRPRVMLSTSLGFGGCNAALVLEAA